MSSFSDDNPENEHILEGDSESGFLPNNLELALTNSTTVQRFAFRTEQTYFWLVSGACGVNQANEYLESAYDNISFKDLAEKLNIKIPDSLVTWAEGLTLEAYNWARMLEAAETPDITSTDNFQTASPIGDVANIHKVIARAVDDLNSSSPDENQTVAEIKRLMEAEPKAYFRVHSAI